MRKIISTFEIEDNDFVEHKLFITLDALGCSDFQRLPNTKDMYDKDPVFRELCKKVKDAKYIRDTYINEKNNVYLQKK